MLSKTVNCIKINGKKEENDDWPNLYGGCHGNSVNMKVEISELLSD